ncbi:hypothetical protein L1987_57616 [Smallanthus sonchifolius]|uniref:Uncharacterized protein n=1 Tax=Smallanthus sonchifolius TaxID=185202 RepID=A0ACB9DD19_9ASTR|nr:hypothetical protein L1987_57616 [Smallanthus sonchifolius]
MHLENKIPTDPVTISANGGYSWSLKIKQVGDGYCFTNGWNKVVEDIPLDFGDFLYFRLVDQSAFRISIYGLDECEMMLPPKTEQGEAVGGEFEDLVLEDDEKNEEDDDPFFTSVITKTHRKMLWLAGIDGDERSMTMKNLDGKEWDMGLRLDMSFKLKRNYLSKGWPDKPKREYRGRLAPASGGYDGSDPISSDRQGWHAPIDGKGRKRASVGADASPANGCSGARVPMNAD